MKSTGMVRKVDDLGRVVLPKELRQMLGIEKSETMDACVEIFVDGENIVLKKYEPACMFCGEAKGVVSFKGRLICPACIAQLQAAAEAAEAGQ